MKSLFILPPATVLVQLVPIAPWAGRMPALGEVPAASQRVVTALQTQVQVLVALGLLCGKLLMGSHLSPPSQVGYSLFVACLCLLWTQPQSWLVSEGNRPSVHLMQTFAALALGIWAQQYTFLF